MTLEQMKAVHDLLDLLIPVVVPPLCLIPWLCRRTCARHVASFVLSVTVFTILWYLVWEVNGRDVEIELAQQGGDPAYDGVMGNIIHELFGPFIGVFVTWVWTLILRCFPGSELSLRME